jgi:hypothetical protein
MLNLILKDNIWFQLDVIEHYVFGLKFVEFYFVFFSFDKNIYKHLFEIFFLLNILIELKKNKDFHFSFDLIF